MQDKYTFARMLNGMMKYSQQDYNKTIWVQAKASNEMLESHS